TLVLVAVGQHGQETSALDGGRQLALIDRAGAGQASRDDLAVFGDEVAQGVDVLVVDLFNTGNGEAAETLATEQQRLGVALALAVFGELAFATGRKCHGGPLYVRRCVGIR